MEKRFGVNSFKSGRTTWEKGEGKERGTPTPETFILERSKFKREETGNKLRRTLKIQERGEGLLARCYTGLRTTRLLPF